MEEQMYQDVKARLTSGMKKKDFVKDKQYNINKLSRFSSFLDKHLEKGSCQPANSKDKSSKQRTLQTGVIYDFTRNRF